MPSLLRGVRPPQLVFNNITGEHEWEAPTDEMVGLNPLMAPVSPLVYPGVDIGGRWGAGPRRPYMDPDLIDLDLPFAPFIQQG